jgi:hypothetical protein
VYPLEPKVGIADDEQAVHIAVYPHSTVESVSPGYTKEPNSIPTGWPLPLFGTVAD